MTTIAWDGKILAADKLADASNLRRTMSKIRDCGKYVYAGCGAIQDLELISDWLRQGAPADKRPSLDEGGGAGIAVEKETGVAYHVLGKHVCLHLYVDIHQADGSGRDFAISAMAFGKNAIEAVEFASRFDIGTGHGVDSWTAPER
jgi:hypothetical protein